ncbi:unnamed protein product [Cyclocybe aegerita]|uniref:Uncharacterized protein n=1 Tax=Cyclocybe aegerita TaxID=1973307 RepID=A0A8S0WKF7_CYCAE|nr:unnamed protein product [Cyclocybe aegerita]
MKLFAAIVLAALAVVGLASPTIEAPASFIMTDAQFKNWLATTDAEITYAGEPPIDNPLAERDTQSLQITYCTHRANNICGGRCTVYRGPSPACVDAPDTNCIASTRDVGFCTRKDCHPTCQQLSHCATQLADGFCFTPNTNSIIVGPA